jgi:hypothetical protein
MFLSDDMYIPAFLDYEFEDLVNEFFILKDDDADNYNKSYPLMVYLFVLVMHRTMTLLPLLLVESRRVPY